MPSGFYAVKDWYGEAMRSSKPMRSPFLQAYAVSIEEQMRSLIAEAEKIDAVSSFADAVLKKHAVSFLK